jgi:hypothetical protein
MLFIAPAFTDAGVTFVSAGYRLAPQHVFPAAVDDCVRAVDWVRRNVANHGGDPQQRSSAVGRPVVTTPALLAVGDAWLKDIGTPRSVVHRLPISAVFEFGAGSGLVCGRAGTDPASERARVHLAARRAAAISDRVRHARLSTSLRRARDSRQRWKRCGRRNCRLPSARISQRASRRRTDGPVRTRSPSWQGIAADRRRDAASSREKR